MNTNFYNMDHEIFIKQLQKQHYMVESEWDAPDQDAPQPTEPRVFGSPERDIRDHKEDQKHRQASSSRPRTVQLSKGQKRKRKYPERPAIGQPGGLDDPLRKGLSGAGVRWYLRHLAQGIPAEEARKMAAERKKGEPFASDASENKRGGNTKRKAPGSRIVTSAADRPTSSAMDSANSLNTRYFDQSSAYNLHTEERRVERSSERQQQFNRVEPQWRSPNQDTTQPKKIGEAQWLTRDKTLASSGFTTDLDDNDLRFLGDIQFTNPNTAPGPSTKWRSVSPNEWKGMSTTERRSASPTEQRNASPTEYRSLSRYTGSSDQPERGRPSQPLKRQRLSPSPDFSQRGNYMRGSTRPANTFSSSYNQSQSDRGRPSHSTKKQRLNASPEVFQGDNYVRGSSRQVTTVNSSYSQDNPMSRFSGQMTTPISSSSQDQPDSGRSSQPMKRQRFLEPSEGANSSYSQPFTKSAKPIKVAIIDKLRPLTSPQVNLVKNELTRLLDSTLSNTVGEVPKFRSLNYAHMRLNITCENRSSFDWLRNAISRLSYLWEGAALDVVSPKKDRPANLTKVTLWIPDTSDERHVILRRLTVQNPWANVKTWSHFHCEFREAPKGALLVFGVDEVTYNLLESRNGRLNYMFISVRVRMKKKNSANEARLKADAPRSAELEEGRRRDY